MLDGGFAAAHAWVARDCQNVKPNEVLVDYDEDSSLFADLEKAYQLQKEFTTANARRKTTLAMQKLIDNSMVRLTNAENQIEEFTDRFISARNQARANPSFDEDDDKGKSVSGDAQSIETETEDMNFPQQSIGGTRFKKAFAGMRKKDKEDFPGESKAFDLSKISFGNLKQREKSKEASMKPEKKDDFERTKELNQRFDFGKIFTNPKPKVSKEDADLEKAIDDSLSPPEDKRTNDEKSKTSNHAKIDEQNSPNAPNPKANFKGVFKKNPFVKFGSFKRNPAPKKESGALREEEAILFDEDD